MAKVIDDISEEIRREDLFNKAKKALPFVGGLCILILIGSAFYAWRNHAYEKQLARDEKIYQQALVHIETKEFDKAQSLLDSLTTSPGLHFLARMQKARIEKTDFLLTGSKKALGAFTQTFRSIEKEYTSLPVQNFLTLSQAFSTSASDLQGDKKVQSFFTRESPWYPLALSWKALHAYNTGNKKEIAAAFALWSNEVSRLEKQIPTSAGPLPWISRCATMGTLLGGQP